MAEFPAVIALSSLNGTTGFKISGVADNDYSGFSVSSAGDVNGDGLDDVIVGAYAADTNGQFSGASYVVFGKAGGFDARLALSSLNGSNGFRITGQAAYDQSGQSVSSAGDVNGDGFDDIIVGAPYADPNGNYSGASYVVFGKAGGFDRTLALSSLNGGNGFKITGESERDRSGNSVSSAGDVNGDGVDDIIVGAPYADPNGDRSGASYVVFGKAGRFDATIPLSSLDGSNGFKITGEAAYDNSGRSVSSAGDVNGDGIDDIIVGAYRADPNGTSSGASYVVFGKAGGFARTLALSSLNGTNGFKITGEAVGDYSGRSVSSAGDVNGDGLDDLIVGAGLADSNGNYAGASYVVFGKAGGFDRTLALSSLNGSNGFKITGEAANDRSGSSVSSAGDVNGDGFDDLIVGADRANGNGANSGASYVVFGKAGGFDRTLALSSLNGTNGFKLTGEGVGDRSGYSVSSTGDVNGDGFDDLVVGAFRADPNGINPGASYVIFGRAPDAAVIRTGTEADNTISGGAFNDRLDGLDGDDTLIGNGGNDQLFGGAGDDTLIGGDGSDMAIYLGSSSAVQVDLSLTTAQSGGDAAGDILSGIENVFGSDHDDTLTGNRDANILIGGAGIDTLDGRAGDDRLDGRTGADTMTGGAGDDLYYVDEAGDTIVEAADRAEGSADRVLARADYTLDDDVGIEFLQALVDTGLSLTGNGFAQTITGRGGADTLDGGGGRDVLRGLAGDDTYIVGEAGVIVVEAADGGNDTVESSVSFKLGANIETLTLTGTDAIDGTGNAGVNTLTGNAAANRLDGGGGADTLIGGAGSDTYLVDAQGDTITEAAGQGDNDTVLASASYALRTGVSIETLATTRTIGEDAIGLTGNEIAQTLTGNQGANVLDGKAGSDVLRGYGGADSFTFSTDLGANTIDGIVDFRSGQDRIALDADTFTALAAGPLSESAFKVTSARGAVVDADDRILYDKTTGALSYDADGAGDQAQAVQFATLLNKTTLTFQDIDIV